eukprot:10112915-Lingulodinium_polyedra.AAC.1
MRTSPNQTRAPACSKTSKPAARITASRPPYTTMDGITVQLKACTGFNSPDGFAPRHPVAGTAARSREAGRPAM